MAVQSSAELLDFFKSESGLPAVNDEFPTDAPIWTYLSLAQQMVFRQIATIAPNAVVGDPELLTTSDGGYTYQFAHYPFGHAEIRESRTGAPLNPGAEYDSSSDFVQEGQQIRWPDNRQRTFDDGPYARYAATPGDIDADNEPTLKPAQARVLIAYRALDLWAAKGGYRDPTPFRDQYTLLAWGSQGDPGILGALRAQYARQGGGGNRGSVSNLAQWAANSSPDI